MILKGGVLFLFLIGPQLQALFPDDLIEPVKKIHIPVRAQQHTADLLILFDEAEQIQQDRLRLPGHIIILMEGNDVVQSLEHTVFDFFQHIEDIPVIQIKGAPVHIGQIGQLPDRDFADLFLLQQPGQRLGQQLFRPPDTAVFFFGKHPVGLIHGFKAFFLNNFRISVG